MVESSFTIQEMVQLLKVRKHTHGHTALFLGARTGGLFRSQSFYNSLRHFSLRDFSGLDGFERFDECYRVLNRPGNFVETDIDRILTLAQQRVSTIYADICLADLLKQGLFDFVITTCVDDILEQALIHIGLKEPYDFSVIIPKSGTNAPEKYIDRNGIFKILKVFGDLVSREYTTTRRVSHIQAHEDVRRVLEETRTRDVLMVGFDHVWDGDVLSSLFPRSARNSFWYVNDQEPAEKMPIYPYLQDCQAKWISGLEGNYENFFQELHLQITGKSFIPPYQVEQDILRELRVIKADFQKILQASASEFEALRQDVLQSLLSNFEMLRNEVLQMVEAQREGLRRLATSDQQQTENEDPPGDEKAVENEKA